MAHKHDNYCGQYLSGRRLKGEAFEEKKFVQAFDKLTYLCVNVNWDFGVIHSKGSGYNRKY